MDILEQTNYRWTISIVQDKSGVLYYRVSENEIFWHSWLFNRVKNVRNVNTVVDFIERIPTTSVIFDGRWKLLNEPTIL